MAVDIARFLSGIESPVTRVQQGVEFGQQQSDRRAAQEAAQAKAEQKRKVQAELLALSQKENRTADDFQDLIIRNPGLAKTFQASIDQLNTEAKTATITEATNVFAALSSGNTDAALKIVEDRKEAAQNSGDQQQVQKAEVLIQAIKSDPKAALTSTGLFLSNIIDADKFKNLLEVVSPKPKKVSANIKTFQSKRDPSKTFALNLNNPEDVEFLNENRTDLIPAPTRQETGAAGAFASGGKAEQKELNVLATGVNKFLRNIDRAVNSLRIEPASGQIIGDIALFADNMAENLRSLSAQTGVSDDDVERDLADFSGLVEPIAAATAQFNSALIDAAYAKALIQNGSRPTDQDFQNAYKTITGGSQNPRILIRSLNNAAKDVEADFRFRFRQSTGKVFKGSFDFRSGDNIKFDFSKMTKAELEAIDPKSLSPADLDAAEKRFGEF